MYGTPLVSRLWQVAASPFIYDGGHEEKKAEELYEKIFDVPIQKGEREKILKALTSTWDWGQAQAGLLNIDQKKVLLVRQHINVLNQGDNWAEIEIHETYENQGRLAEVS